MRVFILEQLQSVQWSLLHIYKSSDQENLTKVKTVYLVGLITLSY
jgi:hypothetical protein